MSLDCSSVVNDIAPLFRPYVQNVYQDLKLGLFKSRVEIEKIGNLSGSDCNIRITLPYCSKKLKWEVLFDYSVPWFAPDFRFDDDTFLNNIDEDYFEEKVPSLNNWNENDPKALSKVISELVELYKYHQIKKLNEDEGSRACFEYSALLGALPSDNDIEVFVGGHIVEFLIKLNVDVTGLPELYNKTIMNEQNPGIDTALLLVRYPNSTNAELILSPLLSKSLGNITLPLMHQTGVLMDYVPMVTDLLNNKIRELLNNEKLKREILAMMVVKYEGAILEHDSSSASFLFETSDFHWILHVEVDPKFPEKLPVLTLRSVYHCSKGKPKSKVLPSCPYNNFEAYIEQQVEIFKNECKGLVTNNQIFNTEP